MKIPTHLATHRAVGLSIDEPVAQFEIGDYKNFVYLVLDWRERKAAIIDPQKDLSAPLQALKDHGFALEAILLTHTHFDHIAGVPELARSFPEVPILVHELDLHRLPSSIRASASIRRLRDGEKSRLGALEIEALHTPGHSAGESCFFLAQTSPPYLFTGDTIFIRDCGRTDLESGSTHEMYESLQKVKNLPLATVILPGHHYAQECASTLEREMLESPPFQCANATELEALP